MGRALSIRPASVDIEAVLGDLSERLMRTDPSIGRGRMLRSVGLTSGGKFFALTADDDLGLKLPAERVTELLASGAGRPFTRGNGPPMREWVRVRPEDPPSCEAYVLEACDFVASLRATDTE